MRIFLYARALYLLLAGIQCLRGTVRYASRTLFIRLAYSIQVIYAVVYAMKIVHWTLDGINSPQCKAMFVVPHVL